MLNKMQINDVLEGLRDPEDPEDAPENSQDGFKCSKFTYLQLFPYSFFYRR